MVEKLDTAKAKLTIISLELSPEEISRKLDLGWDDARRKGDRKGRTNQIWDTNAWYLYETAEGNGNGIPVEKALAECFKRLRERIGNAVESIRALSETETVELGLYILAENIPPIHLTPDILAFIHHLGADLDVDIVLYGDQE